MFPTLSISPSFYSSLGTLPYLNYWIFGSKPLVISIKDCNSLAISLIYCQCHLCGPCLSQCWLQDPFSKYLVTK